ncbi:esterase [Klebsiella pneumoniae]|uniref:Esterase n=1 Tax=Klebsiella pneumoniae TaxID=573 RepID=A0A377ZZ54_KLEPN|nr:esterase [Klebsiella pneumoniae]
MIGSNSDEASVMAVFGVDIAGQIQKLRRERRLGLGLIKLLYPGVKAMKRWAGICRDMPSPPLVMYDAGATARGAAVWRYWFDYVAEAEQDAYPHGAWHGNEVPYVFDNLRLTDPVRQYASERIWPSPLRSLTTGRSLPASPAASRRFPAQCAGRRACAGGIACCALACISAPGLKWKPLYARQTGAVSPGDEASRDAG